MLYLDFFVKKKFKLGYSLKLKYLNVFLGRIELFKMCIIFL